MMQAAFGLGTRRFSPPFTQILLSCFLLRPGPSGLEMAFSEAGLHPELLESASVACIQPFVSISCTDVPDGFQMDLLCFNIHELQFLNRRV